MRLIFILLITSITTTAQQINYEQKSFDYFFNNMFEEKYPTVKTIQFDGKTERELSEFGLFTNCFKDNDPIWKKLYVNALDKSLSEKSIDVTTTRNVSFKNRRVKSKIKLHILQANEVEGKFYIMLELIKSMHYTHAYFFEFDQAGNLMRWCETGMTH